MLQSRQDSSQRAIERSGIGIGQDRDAEAPVVGKVAVGTDENLADLGFAVLQDCWISGMPRNGCNPLSSPPIREARPPARIRPVRATAVLLRVCGEPRAADGDGVFEDR